MVDGLMFAYFKWTLHAAQCTLFLQTPLTFLLLDISFCLLKPVTFNLSFSILTFNWLPLSLRTIRREGGHFPALSPPILFSLHTGIPISSLFAIFLFANPPLIYHNPDPFTQGCGSSNSFQLQNLSFSTQIVPISREKQLFMLSS